MVDEPDKLADFNHLQACERVMARVSRNVRLRHDAKRNPKE